MKRIYSLISVVLIALSVLALRYYRTRPRLATTTPIAAQPLPTKTDPPVVAPQQRRLAPAGVFFLTERVALAMKSGVVAFAPGTCVRVVSTNGDIFRVTDGTTTLDVSREKLTDDLDQAATLAQSDCESQKAIAAHIGSEVELHRQQVDAAGAQHERNMQLLEARRREALRLAAENMITPAEADILNLREVRHDMSGNIIYGYATDGISVGPGQVRSFREQAELVKRHKLPELTTEERRERWREDYLYTQQHKTPDVIVIHGRR